MKRVKDGDIKIKLSDLKGLTPNFRIRFYTTNSNYYIEKTSIDLMWDEEDEETEYIKLNWSELQAIGRGVMNYNLMTYENDDDFDDGIYDHYYQRTTDYFIDTDIIIDDDQPDKTVSELIAEIDQKVDEEITRSTDKDEEHDDAIANLQEQIDNIDVDVDLSDYYTKEEIDDIEQTTASALNDLNDRIDSIDTSTLATKAELAAETAARTQSENTINQTIEEMDLVTSSALNDLNSRLLDVYTKSEVDEAIDEIEIDLTGYATESWVQQQGYVDSSDLSTVATSGSYNDLSNKPTIPVVPTNVSAFTNDAGYLTQHQDISGKADKATTYTKTEVDQAIDEAIAGGADLTNYYTKTESDAKYAIANNLSTVATSGSYNDLTNKPTIPTVPTNVSAFNNDAGYLTQHQSLSGYATQTWVQQQGYAESSDLSTVATSGSYNDLSDKPTIPTVPTNVSAFTNDAGYLTSHQSLTGYATESWVSTNYYNKTYIDTTIGDIETLLSNI